MEQTNNIEQLMDNLPGSYEEACYKTKTIERNRKIKSARDLMKLCLIYLTQACSLLEISEYAMLLGIGKISDVAFMKKFAKCGPWFEWIISKIKPAPIIKYELPKGLEDYKIIGLDATDVVETGAAKRTWRLHYAINIYEMKSEQYKITAEKTGESLTNFTIKPDYLVLGDRAYGTKTGIVHCLDGKGNFIFRLKSKAFKIYDNKGNEINLLNHIEKAGCEKATGIEVYIKDSKKKYIKLRICVIKKMAVDIEKSRRRINKSDIRKGRTTSEETKKLNDYIVVITSLPEEISADAILSLYRVRWQVELYFKRLKSLMGFGSIPTKKEVSIETWLNGKLMVALLLEKVIATAVSFSPSV